MKDKSRNLQYCLLQGIYWMISSAVVVYAGVFLLDRGYSNTEIGIILAAGNILGAVLQPAVARMADRSRHLSPTAFLSITTLLFMLLAVSALFFRAKAPLLTVIYVLLITLELILLPLVYAYAFILEQLGSEIRFGLARGCGSICWGTASLVIGMLTERWTADAAIWSAIGFAAAMLVLLAFFSRTCPFLLSREAKAEKQKAEVRGSLLKGHPAFLFLLIGIAFLFFGHSFIDNFPYQIVSNVGGSQQQMGVFCFYAAVLEIPALFLFEWLHKRFSCVSLLKFGAFFFIVKDTLTWLVKTLPGLYLANAFQAISFAVVVPAAVRYADENTDPKDTNTAQALITAMMTSGSILSSLLGGRLMDTVSVKGMLLVGAAATLPGAFAVLFGMRNRRTAIDKGDHTV